MLNNDNGFIKLHRKLLNWEWYSNLPTRVLFIHLLLKANYADREWQGKIIKRGTYISSIPKLAKDSGLSIQQTRTALINLQSTNEITKCSTSKYTEITVNNYDKYQEPTRKRTDKQQTNNTQDNRQSTTREEYNNTNVLLSKEEKKERKGSPASAASESGDGGSPEFVKGSGIYGGFDF